MAFYIMIAKFEGGPGEPGARAVCEILLGRNYLSPSNPLAPTLLRWSANNLLVGAM